MGELEAFELIKLLEVGVYFLLSLYLFLVIAVWAYLA